MEFESKLRTVEQISERFLERTTSPTTLTNEYLERIAEQNRRLDLYITVTEDLARRSANESNKRFLSSNGVGRLDGIPIAIKDNFFIKGVRCTAGSKILSEFIPDYTATSVERLERSGAVILGTTNMHEFASGVTTENPHFGVARNPWGQNRICGGSSGGSAAAVAAGLAVAALGTDTAGSVRIPASLCGVVGLKPTYGLVSTRGTVPLSFSLDHIGVLCQSCVDAAIILDSISGYDEKDPFSMKPPYTHEYHKETISSRNQRRKIGVPKKYFQDILDDEVRRTFEIVISNLESFGHELVDVEIPNIQRAEEIWAPIRFSEASAYHDSWLRERPNDYGEDVRTKLERGSRFSAVEYILAKKNAVEFRERVLKTMKEVDAFVTPTTPIPAPKIGEGIVSVGSMKLDVYSIMVRQTLPFNVAGFPAVSLPMGLTKEGLPMGFQIAGRPFEEAVILGIGSTYETKFGKVGPASEFA